jgi:hypothetical protein
VLGLALAAVLVGCTTGGAPATTGAATPPAGPTASTGAATTAGSTTVAAIPVPVSRAPQQATVERWGAAPRPGPEVTLQPDVIIVGGGGKAIRNATEDGLTYYLDPAAPRAGDLTRGSVMFVTGRVVGRVLDVRRAGADLAVTIGPVSLTEIFRDIDLTSSAPVDLSAPASYPAGEPFWGSQLAGPEQAGPSGLRNGPAALIPAGRATDRAAAPSSAIGAPGGSGGSGGPAGSGAPGGSGGSGGSALPDLPRGPMLPALPPSGSLPAVPARAAQALPSADALGKQVGSSGLRLTPVCCDGGVGTHFSYDRNGVRAVGDVQLQITRPTVDFVLKISGGTLIEAGLRVNGAAGLKVSVTAARQDSDAQINEKVAIPLDFSVPLSAFGIPLSAVVNQWVVVKSAFSAKTGVIAISGEYSLKAGLGFSYRNGSFSAAAPASLTVRQSINDTMDGLSLGPMGVVLSYQARFLVGVGAFGFTAGVYFGLTASLGITRGSDAGVFAPGTGGTQRIVCRSTRLSLYANYGVGYSIPAPVADLINLFLKVFRTTPIERTGGIGGQAKIFDKQTFTPDLKVCGGSV